MSLWLAIPLFIAWLFGGECVILFLLGFDFKNGDFKLPK